MILILFLFVLCKMRVLKIFCGELLGLLKCCRKMLGSFSNWLRCFMWCSCLGFDILFVKMIIWYWLLLGKDFLKLIVFLLVCFFMVCEGRCLFIGMLGVRYCLDIIELVFLVISNLVLYLIVVVFENGRLFCNLFLVFLREKFFVIFVCFDRVLLKVMSCLVVNLCFLL